MITSATIPATPQSHRRNAHDFTITTPNIQSESNAESASITSQSETPIIASSTEIGNSEQRITVNHQAKLSNLLTLLTRDPNDQARVSCAQKLISLLRNANSENPNMLDSHLIQEKLENLLKLTNSPDQLSSEIENLSPEFLASLKSSTAKESDIDLNLMKSLISHGPVAAHFANLSQQNQNQILDMFKQLSTNAQSSPSNQADEQVLLEFQNRLNTVIQKKYDSLQVTNIPQALLQHHRRNAELQFTNDLSRIQQEFNGKLDSKHLQQLSANFLELKNHAQKPENQSLLETWSRNIFTKEGALAATMLVPFVSSLLSTVLGDLPVIGNLCKSLTQLSSNISSYAERLIQTLTILNQQDTNKAVKALQKQSSSLSATEHKTTTVI
jgi:hypothetical protein